MTQARKAMFTGDGNFEDIAGVLTMLNHRRHTGALHFQGKVAGVMFYVAGEICHAQQGERTGKEAFEELMRQSVTQEVPYEFHRDQTSALSTIDQPHDFLLMAVAKVVDEEKERETRIQQEDPSAFSLNTNPDLVDTLDLFREVPMPQEPPMASQMILDDPELFRGEDDVGLADEPLLTLETWVAVRQVLTESIGPSAGRVLKMLCRELNYPLVDNVGQVPMRDTGRFLNALGEYVERMVPQEAARVQGRLSELGRQFT